MSYNSSHSNVSSLFDNISTSGGNIAYHVNYSLPYDSIFGYPLLIFVIVGLIGNVLSIAVLTRPKYQNSSTATYLTALAFSDIIVLLSGPLTEFLDIVYNFYLLAQGTFLCKFLLWFVYGSMTTSAWLLVAVTIERTISVTFPYQVKRSCTPKIAKNVVIAIWCAMYVLYSHFIYGIELVHYNGSTICGITTNDYNVFFHYVLPWIDVTMVFLMPCLFILIGNIVIIVQLVRNRRKRLTMTRSKQQAETKLIVTIVVVNVAFMLTMSPLTIFYIIAVYLDMSLSTYLLLQYVLALVANVNAVANFYLYFLIGAKFRDDLKELFKSVSLKVRERPV